VIARLTPALILVAVLAGVLVGGRPEVDPRTPVLLAATLAVVSGVLAVTARRRSAGAVALLGLSFLGVGASARATDGLERSPLRGPISERARGTLTGAVVGDPVAGAWRVAVTVRSDVWAGDRSRRRAAGTRSVLVVAAPAEASRFRALVAGDRVAVRGRLGPLDGYDARLRWRHIVGRLDGAGLVDLAPARAPVLRAANGLRTLVARGGAGLPARERGLLAAFLLGDERGIPPETIVTFRAAGMSHLLVVSGANVAAVLAMVGPVTRRSPLFLRCIIGVGALALFGAATRWEPSVLRAIAMASGVLIGAVLGRPLHGARVLALAVSALLLLDPFLVQSIGFRLSCAATAGIALLAGPIARRLWGPQVVRDAIAVTTAAQIGVAPVLVGTFGTLPLVAIPANLLAAPLVVPITVWGLGAGLVGGLLGGVPARLLQTPTFLALQMVESVAAIAARHPASLDARALAALAGGAAAFGCIRHLYRARGSGVGVRGRR
jgi:competence protein ComEC